ncbi:hypothetical protein A0257_02960 [Hymenobacter psoromatis]|nr:hypothetical protein A0257_02960 [Hymenobacter psoromatis]
MKKILVIGASGFVGSHVARALLAAGYAVRGVARQADKMQELAAAGGEIIPADMADATAMQRVVAGVAAVYIAVHTLSPQPGSTAALGFMDVELAGLQHIVAACRAHGVRRVVYVTFLGAAPDAPSAWVRGRWQAEQLLLRSGLDVTIIRPGQIVGLGGQGFKMMVGQAKSRVAFVLGSGEQKFRNIAVGDLVYYLVGVLDDPRTYGQAYDVGSDDVLTYNQMIDVGADVLGRPHPTKLHLPPALLGTFASLIERITKLPKGAIKGMLDSTKADMVSDPAPIRALLPRPPLPYRQAVAQAVADLTP